MPKRKKKRGIIRNDCAIGEEKVESLKFKVEREQSIGERYQRSDISDQEARKGLHRVHRAHRVRREEERGRRVGKQGKLGVWP
jgi:hypothetical protein